MKTMLPLTSFDHLLQHLQQGTTRRRVAVVCGTDASTLDAVVQALAQRVAEVVFVGDRSATEGCAALQPYADRIAYIDVADPHVAADRAVQLVREGGADVLMKGLVHTDVLLRAVLNKETGILPAGRTLLHIAVAQLPAYDKLLFFTDSAVLPEPTEAQREAQIDAVVGVCRAFGIAAPRISLVHFTESVSEKFPLTFHYRRLAEAAAAGRWGDAVVDGPLDVRTAVDPVALATKGIASPIGGQADALIFPNLEAGNAFYKTVSFFGRAELAGMLQGTDVPVVLSSRGDDARSKFLSLAAACLTAPHS